MALTWLTTLRQHNASHPPHPNPAVNEDALLDALVAKSLHTHDAIPRFYHKPTLPQPTATTPHQPPAPTLKHRFNRLAQQHYIAAHIQYVIDQPGLAVLWHTLNTHATHDIHHTLSRRNSLQSVLNTHTDDAGNSVDIADHSASALHTTTTGANSNNNTGGDADKRISYADMCTAVSTLSSELQQSIHAQYTHNLSSLFNLFHIDDCGRIPIKQLFYYMYNHNVTYTLRLNLLCYDENNTATLSEHDLENYIFDQISTQQYSALATLDADFYPYYVFTVCSKLMFLGDRHKCNKISIEWLAHSAMLHEFNDLKYNVSARKFPVQSGSTTTTPVKAKNWCSLQWCHQLYSLYLSLDTNQNGMLDLNEFCRFNGGSMTSMFINQLFNTYRMYLTAVPCDAVQSGVSVQMTRDVLEMDYKTFLEFMLALEYKQSPSSIQYFYRILCSLSNETTLSMPSVKLWFGAVRDKLVSLGHPAPDVEAVTLEIIDMVTPVDARYITLDDLIKCGVGHTVMQILTDVNGFWRYDNRETLMHQQQNDDTL